MSKDLREVIGGNLDRNAGSAPGDVLECRACAEKFVRGDWCFHQLCGGCFAAFDTKKMMGRFGAGQVCEDAEEWIRSMSEKPVC
jgi:hypothetical protein